RRCKTALKHSASVPSHPRAHASPSVGDKFNCLIAESGFIFVAINRPRKTFRSVDKNPEKTATQTIDRAGLAALGNRPCLVRNSIIKRSNSQGCSIWQAWPAPGNVFNSQLGMSA